MTDDTVLPITAQEFRAAVAKARADGKEEGKREIMARFRDLLAKTDKLRSRVADPQFASADAELDALIATIERRKR